MAQAQLKKVQIHIQKSQIWTSIHVSQKPTFSSLTHVSTSVYSLHHHCNRNPQAVFWVHTQTFAWMGYKVQPPVLPGSATFPCHFRGWVSHSCTNYFWIDTNHCHSYLILRSVCGTKPTPILCSQKYLFFPIDCKNINLSWLWLPKRSVCCKSGRMRQVISMFKLTHRHVFFKNTSFYILVTNCINT